MSCFRFVLVLQVPLFVSLSGFCLPAAKLILHFIVIMFSFILL